MDGQAILARLFARIAFSADSLHWLEKARAHQLWLGESDGQLFFVQFRATWEQVLKEACEPLIHRYFLDGGHPPENLPKIKLLQAYSGSWNMEAAVTITQTADTTHSTPASLVTGLTQLQHRLSKSFSELMNQRVRERLDFPTGVKLLPPPPSVPIVADLRVETQTLFGLPVA